MHAADEETKCGKKLGASCDQEVQLCGDVIQGPDGRVGCSFRWKAIAGTPQLSAERLRGKYGTGSTGVL